MKLWIRTQDKKKLCIIEDLFICEVNKERWDIKTQINGTVGSYKSEERCLEILDEIQNILNSKLQMVGKLGKNFQIDENGVIESSLGKCEYIQAPIYIWHMPNE